MTRQYNQQFQCASCGCTTTTETSFGRWLRSNPRLDSRDGFTAYDIDYVVHKYKTVAGNGGTNRDYQLIMLVEVKTKNGTVSESQRDTLYILSQIIENRRGNRHTGKASHNNWHRNSSGPLKVFSSANQKYVSVRCYGFYTLRFSNLGPDDSDDIFWNKKKIDTDTLEKLLNFDIDPDTFIDINEALRNRHSQPAKPLFDSQ